MNPDVRDLLAAIVEALDIPLPGLTDADERAHRKILAERAGRTRIIAKSALDILGSALDEDEGIAGATAHLRRWTAETPVTYSAYRDADQDGEPR